MKKPYYSKLCSAKKKKISFTVEGREVTMKDVHFGSDLCFSDCQSVLALTIEALWHWSLSFTLKRISPIDCDDTTRWMRHILSGRVMHSLYPELFCLHSIISSEIQLDDRSLALEIVLPVSKCVYQRRPMSCSHSTDDVSTGN